MVKVLKVDKYSSNGEEVELKVSETEKGLQIDINGLTMDVLVNGDIFYSKFDKEEYKYIPPLLRGYVEEHLCTYSDGIYKEKGKVNMDLLIRGREYFVQIPTKRAKNNTITFTDYLNSYEKIQDYLNSQIEGAEKRYKNLLRDIETIGYKLGISHDGNEYDDWYSLYVPIDQFSEDKINQCLELWDQYNEELEKYIEKI
ncbi:hypothetical protein [Halalkalibacter oceani]|uniref:hypothetical protein n=1 Tax=Halalkalibacter oceani TaxID=1653776 RepID=UPI0033953442